MLIGILLYFGANIATQDQAGRTGLQEELCPVKRGAQLRGIFNMGPLSLASKYVEELGPIKQDVNLSRDRLGGIHCKIT